MAAIFDIGVLLVLFISAGVSFFRGFIREVLTIVGVIGGAVAALIFGKAMIPITRGWFGIVEGQDPGKFMDMIPKEMAADVTAYAVIFLSVFIILQLASHFFAAAVAAIGLGPVDRTLGVIFGLARGLIFLGLLFMVANIFIDQKVPNSDKTFREEYLADSKTLFYVEGTSKWLRGMMPDSAEEAKNTTREKLKELDVLDSGKDHDTSSEAPDEAKPDAAQQEQDGYNESDRMKLDGLIENQAPQANPDDPRKLND